MPPKDINLIENMKRDRKGYKIKDLKAEEYLFMLQERKRSTFNQSKINGFITICGHTANLGEIVRSKTEGFIRIDAGCGHKQSNSKLAFYCIEDDTVEYIEEKESIKEAMVK